MFDTRSNLLLRVSSFFVFFLIWSFASVVTDSTILPSPTDVFKTINQEFSNSELIFHTLITLKRVFISFFIAMFIGMAIGIALGRRKNLNVFFDDWLVLGLNVPALVLIILCYVWFGLNEVAAILAVSLNKIPMVAVIMREGSRALDKQYSEVAYFYNISKKKMFFKVILPQLYPYVMSAARSGLSLIWKIVLVVELLGRSNGVGFKLYGFFQFFDISGILAYTLTFVFVIIIVELLLIRPIEKNISEWR